MTFDDKYYKETIAKYNYNPMDFAPMDFEFCGIPKATMKAKWLCHSGIDNIDTTDRNSFIVTTGVGLSGIPHMGTLSQILRAIFLQKNGVNVQIVLGDLDSYNARNKDLQYVIELSKRYEEFIISLGFDTKKGILRNQYDFPKLNQNAYLLSKYVTDQDFADTEEDLSKLYIEKKIYDGITFSVKQAILLMISDFISLSDDYKNIVVMLGLEEHKYVRLARIMMERMGNESNLYSMYSKIITGLNGYPKMSKSIQESAISVDMSSEEIAKKIVEQSNDYDVPENSVIYQMMTSVSDYNVSDLNLIYDECLSKSVCWEERKKEYAERLGRICENWI